MPKFTVQRTGAAQIDKNFDQLRVITDNVLNKLLDNGNLRLPGNLGVGNAQLASTPGTVVGKVEIFDKNGNSLGFLALYNHIT